MGLLFRLLELLVLAAPVIGVIYAGIRALSSLNRQRQSSGDPAEPAADSGEVGNHASHWRAIRRAIDAHDHTDARWLEYELDPAKLLDFPVMTDMRDPLTTAFHKAKLAADFHRPVRAEDLVDDREGTRHYLDAVESYVTAFNAAETEAIRKGRNDFSREERQRLARAQSLLRVAADTSATQQERQRAYGLARTELDGLIVLPGSIRASIERGIAGEIDG
ncbi:hypothetical protein B4U45_28255 [Mycobacterium persicum]|uniref:Uncharacterized protein n=1 Tax=Mycobacterium persicum TaxID=1487726 RepID=A0A8E2IZ97_9MYCO|nr:hypothetical protein [Mycobacterium persicum]KZS80215.1 hypothetical protein A4G31_26415 [Mycobacterium persicum]ORB97836.1 hypothetical protein B1T44_28760 [Mycobacterium persicum]ORC09909.1 hypothetical protein B4U45_28255 [Mycobacterium persicum]VAZ75629.1 hypothetical protein LAUMK15_02915 [Mycobacterium persicum]VAZ93782.1 hypothetical protein LAUMK4_02590 [Mycobacterium persicum]